MITPTFNLENAILAQGYTLIAGIDEAGRGPWAGPLCAAAVILDIKNFDNDAVRDSKMIPAKKRTELSGWLKENCLTWSIGEVSSEEIDSLGLQLANKTAMKRAITNLTTKPDFILTDYVGRIEFRTPFQVVKSGDKLSFSIAAASIIAKVYRDALMMELAKVYPEYGFEQHKGYGTKLHSEMIKKYGLCPIHRTSFAPIKRVAKSGVTG
ncbi:ribonuclease HII [Candidatus Falkowbacteria bacterium]|nr:ribonuclease HII [Candidatus Falkowbacteria bacterium]